MSDDTKNAPADQPSSFPEAVHDEHSLPRARERATNIELLPCRHAVVDHISMAHCAGFEGGAFNEVRSVWRDLSVQWAGAFGDACLAITKALEMPHQNEAQDKLDLERAIKWKSLLPALLLRKPPSNTGTKASTLKPIVQRRLNQYDAGDWSGLIADYETDVISASLIHVVNSRSQDDK